MAAAADARRKAQLGKQDDDDDSDERPLAPDQWPRNAVEMDERAIERGSTPTLVDALGRQMDAATLEQLSPCPRASYEELCSSSSGPPARGLAVLVSGHPRTMVEPDVIHEYMRLMQLAQAARPVHVFANLDYRQGTDKMRSRPVEVGRLRAALQQWQVPFTLQDAGLPANASSALRCGRSVCWPEAAARVGSTQRTKVAGAIEMMRAAERQRGSLFELAMRVRPDLCIRPAFRSLSTVLSHMTHCSPLIATWHDSLAVVPR